MEYISLIVNEDAAHNCLADLGRLGVIQFTDVSLATIVVPSSTFGTPQLRKTLCNFTAPATLI
jgi:hypothetical protein